MQRRTWRAGVGGILAVAAVLLLASAAVMDTPAHRPRTGPAAAHGRISPGLGGWTAKAADRYWTTARMQDDTGEHDPSHAGAAGIRHTSGDTAGSVQFPGVPSVGKLFMTGTHVGDSGISENAGECTASVVDSPGRNLIATAAHCIDDPDRYGHFAFVPQYHDGQKPFGAFPVNLKRVWLDPRYLGRHDAGDRYDIAFAEVGPGLDGRNVQDVLGANRMAFDAGHVHTVQLIGYSVYEGRPRGCTGRTRPFDDGGFLQIDCAGYDDGTSGSPWLMDFNGKTGRILGVIGGWHTGGDDPDTSYSAYLGRDAEKLYAHARAGTDPTELRGTLPH